jgi:hypothetical protein
MSSLDGFKADVLGLGTVNGKQIKKLTDYAKTHKEEADFLVEIIVNSIKEVS